MIFFIEKKGKIRRIFDIKNDTESQNFAIFDIKLISKINFGAQFTHVLTVFEDHRESSQLWPPQQMAEVS